MTLNDRRKLKSLLEKGFDAADCARALGVCERTIYNELRRGCDESPGAVMIGFIVYDPELAQSRIKKRGPKAGEAGLSEERKKWTEVDFSIKTSKDFETNVTRVYTMLREKITSGELAFGTLLPSERYLMDETNTTMATVRNAYKRLCDEGYALAFSTRGRYVFYRDNSRVTVLAREESAI